MYVYYGSVTRNIVIIIFERRKGNHTYSHYNIIPIYVLSIFNVIPSTVKNTVAVKKAAGYYRIWQWTFKV